MPADAEPVGFESFLVRIWHEPVSRAWRGTVIHMPSRESCDFANLEQALAFILGYVPIRPAGPPPGAVGSQVDET